MSAGRLASPRSRTLLAVTLAVAAAIAVVIGHSALQPTPTRGSGLAALPLGVAGAAPGACAAYAPAGHPNGKTVFVDAGHGGVDPGAVAFTAAGSPVLEKDLTLAVATRLAGMLTADGYRVAMARTADTSVAELGADDVVAGALTADAQRRDVAKRIECANAAVAAVLISIHFNSGAGPGIGGTQTYYDPARPFARASRALAKDVQSSLVGALGSNDRGVWPDDQLPSAAAELGPASRGGAGAASAMPGVVAEPLFMTDPGELAFATDPRGQERIALGLKIGIEAFLGAGGG